MINRWSVSVSLLNLTTHWMTGNHRSALDGLFLLAFFRVTRVIYSRLNRHLLGAFRFSREIVFKKTTTKITVLFAFWLVSLEKRLVIICRFIDLFVHLELAAVTIKGFQLFAFFIGFWDYNSLSKCGGEITIVLLCNSNPLACWWLMIPNTHDEFRNKHQLASFSGATLALGDGCPRNYTMTRNEILAEGKNFKHFVLKRKRKFVSSFLKMKDNYRPSEMMSTILFSSRIESS